MPPSAVKTVRDLIYWKYAKLIAGRAVGDKKNYAFVMYTVNNLRKGQLKPSTILRGNTILVEEEKKCAHYGSTTSLQWKHIIPKSRGGPDTIDNMVMACVNCNHSRDDKDPFEWYGLERRYALPRLVLDKYLKLVFDAHEKAGTLDSGDVTGDEKLDVYDLGAVFRKSV